MAWDCSRRTVSWPRCSIRTLQITRGRYHRYYTPYNYRHYLDTCMAARWGCGTHGCCVPWPWWHRLQILQICLDTQTSIHGGLVTWSPASRSSTLPRDAHVVTCQPTLSQVTSVQGLLLRILDRAMYERQRLQRCPSCGSVRDAGSSVSCGLWCGQFQVTRQRPRQWRQPSAGVRRATINTVHCILYYQHIAKPFADTLLYINLFTSLIFYFLFYPFQVNLMTIVAEKRF